MPVNLSNPVSIGLATMVSHYDRLWNNWAATYAGEVAIASQAARDVIFASSSTQLARLAAGTSGQVLQTRGSGTDPNWVYPVNYITWTPGATENAGAPSGLRSGCHNVILVTGSATPAIINGMSSSGMAAGTMITFIVNVNFIQIFHNSSSASNTDYRLMLSDEGDGSIGALMLGPFLSATFVHQGAGGKWIEATVNVAGPRCEVQILGAQSIANNTTTVVNFDDEMFDIWGEFSTVTHLWTAREDMWVDVHGQVSMSTTAAVDLFVEVLINGSVQIALGIAAVPANRSATSHAQCRRYVLKGDTIGLKVLQQSGASQDLVNGLWTSMRISRIR